MIETYEIHRVKSRFTTLLEKLRRGEEIIIADSGKPVARLVPVEPGVVAHTPGSARGRITISANFDAPLPVGLAPRSSDKGVELNW